MIYISSQQNSGRKSRKAGSGIEKPDFRLFSISASENISNNAKVTDRYPKEMYYRLLAAQWLPEKLDKILYLDPDILIINPLYDLWNTDIENYLFAAASHTGTTEMTNKINHKRLDIENDYYNSGVLLINLKLARKIIDPQEVFRFVEETPIELLLLDQDVLNVMFGQQILKIPDARWN